MVGRLTFQNRVVPARVNAARLMPKYFANYSQKRSNSAYPLAEADRKLHAATDRRFR